MSFLDNAPEQNVFILSNGLRVNNIEELYMILSSCDDAIFYSHVNNDRNDFANWIKYVIKHDELYDKLINVKEKQAFLNVLNLDIQFLHNPKLKETAAFFSDDYIDKNSRVSSAAVTNNVAVPSAVTNNVAVPSAVTNNVAVPGAVNDADNPRLKETMAFFSEDYVDKKKPSVGIVPNTIDNPISENSGSPVLSDSGIVLSDFEEILSALIVDINNEIFSWNE